MLSLRQFSLILFVVCSAIIMIAYYLQLTQGALPCCLCVMQRLAFTVLAVSFLWCAVRRPKPQSLWLYMLINLLAVAIGLLASGRQIWLQNRPLSQDNMCIPTFPSALNHHLLVNILNSLGTHQCAAAGPYFLGFDLSLWTFLFFSLLGVVVLMTPLVFARSFSN